MTFIRINSTEVRHIETTEKRQVSEKSDFQSEMTLLGDREVLSLLQDVSTVWLSDHYV